MTEDEMVGWHHRLNRHEFEQEMAKDREAWHAAVYGVTKSWHNLVTKHEVFNLTVFREGYLLNI